MLRLNPGAATGSGVFRRRSVSMCIRARLNAGTRSAGSGVLVRPPSTSRKPLRCISASNFCESACSVMSAGTSTQIDGNAGTSRMASVSGSPSTDNSSDGDSGGHTADNSRYKRS